MGILNGVSTQDEISSGGVQYALIARMKDIKITFVENEGAIASTATYTLADGSAITPLNTPFKKYAFTIETSSADAILTGTPQTGSQTWANAVNMTFHKRDAALRNEVQSLTSQQTSVVMMDCACVNNEGYASQYGGQCGRGLTGTTGNDITGIVSGDLNGNVVNLTGNYPKMPYTVELAHLALIDPDNVLVPPA